MAITTDSGRQNPLIARVKFSGVTADAEVLAIAVYNAILLPANSIITGGYIFIGTVFTATTDFDVGDSDADEYTPTIVPGDALGYTALVPTGIKYLV